MTVVAFAVPGQPGWRWRIVDYNGQMVDESDAVFETMQLALVAGGEHLEQRPERDARVRRQRSAWS
jgi:hypothetical protein